MDWQIFMYYLEETNSKNRLFSFIDTIKRFPLKLKIPFISLFSCLFLLTPITILSLVLRCQGNASSFLEILIFILTLLLTISAIPILIFSAITNNSKSIMEIREKRRAEAFAILEKANNRIFNKKRTLEKNQVKQLHRQLTNRLNSYRAEIQAKKKSLTFLLQIFIFPLLLLIIKEIISSNSTLDVKIVASILSVIVAAFIYMVLYACIKATNLVNSGRYEQLEDFINLLQEILDYNYNISDEDLVAVESFK